MTATVPGCLAARHPPRHLDQRDRGTPQPFLRWCMGNDAMPRLALPPHVIKQDQAPMHQHRRLAVLRRVLHDETLPLRTRIAASLVLLYAQPISRIVRLTTEDVIDDGSALMVRLGDPPSPLPGPVASLVRAYLAEQPRLARASSRSTAWLFPGRQRGRPMDPTSLLE
ncbi:hypothetical protein [Streptomyces sp. NPDC059761]|uniref:hypothetical protein n=1 Tax=Streptomyces sp. NPDC059761 TaxID=3346937 RepID=UPI003646E07C